jgi:uncharacterized protein YcbK (DUF882 family)
MTAAMKLRPITRTFYVEEFDCHDGQPVPASLMSNLHDLCFAVLQPLRDRWAEALYIVSGYRTPAWNSRVGGATSSTHLTAEGADIRPAKMADVARLHAFVLNMYNQGALPALGGLGEYPRWVHVDIRRLPTGRLRQWSGNSQGHEPVA